MLFATVIQSFAPLGIPYLSLKPRRVVLLAAHGHPLATETEISVWYGHEVPARQRN